MVINVHIGKTHVSRTLKMRVSHQAVYSKSWGKKNICSRNVSSVPSAPQTAISNSHFFLTLATFPFKTQAEHYKSPG